MVVRTERLSGPRNCRFVMYPRFSSQATDRSYGLYCGHPGPIMCWTVNETCFQAAQHRCWPLKSQCVPTAHSRHPFSVVSPRFGTGIEQGICMRGPGSERPIISTTSPRGSVPHGAEVERRSAQRPNFDAPFLATVYTRGAILNKIRAVSGFQPRINFARSRNWQLSAKKCCGLRQSGARVSARSQSRNYFEETPFAQANGVSARGRKKANLPRNLLVA